MGCLNSDKNFKHWFGNIHLSGPCNRACYFCIGQHMMGLDNLNNLDTWPLSGIGLFVKECLKRDIREVNLTGTNTDPLLYKHLPELTTFLRSKIKGARLGIRTNGIAFDERLWRLFDKASVTVCSLDKHIYRRMMGGITLPPMAKILAFSDGMDIKINIVLGPENKGHDLFRTMRLLAGMGIKRINLREPYGQPRVGDPMEDFASSRNRLGMPVYDWYGMQVMYWDVHYVEVESVNLYASGRVSVQYPITLGYDATLGKVLDQSNFPGGRIQEQWL